MQRPSILAAGQSGQGPTTGGSLADTAPAGIQPPSSIGESLLQPVQASATQQLLHASAPVAAVVMEAAAVLPATVPLPAASIASSTPPHITAAAATAATLRRGLKLAPPLSPQLAMRQRLQHSRTELDLSKQQQVQPSELPVTYAVSTLTQPGPLFMRSCPESSLDSSTTLPQANSAHRHGQASTAGQCAACLAACCSIAPAQQ